jgi:hypothetical protein
MAMVLAKKGAASAGFSIASDTKLSQSLKNQTLGAPLFKA